MKRVSIVVAACLMIAWIGAQAGLRGTVAASAQTGETVATPVGTPVASRDGVDLLYFHFVDTRFGGTFVLGELRNTTDQLLRAPIVVVTLTDSAGQTVATVEAAPHQFILEPGVVVPFDGLTELEIGAWATESVDFTGGGPATDSDLLYFATGLEVRNVTEVEKTDDTLHLTGEVFNNGRAAASLVEVEVVIYGPDGRYAASQYTTVDLDPLPAGQGAPFELDAQIDVEPGWTYRLMADGSPAS